MSEEKEEDCEACEIAVPLGVAKEVCNIVADEKGRKECSELFEKTILGELDVPEFFDRVEKIVEGDKDAVFSVREAKKIAMEKKDA